jgi:hypothetical protein
MKKLVVLTITILPLLLQAQSMKFINLKQPVHIIASLGAVTGQSPVRPVGQISGGFVNDIFFAGIGTGLDGYLFSSVPLFADIRMNFGKNRMAFVYLNPGYNFPVKRNGTVTAWTTKNKFTGGLYTDIGIGNKVVIGKKARLLFSAGYSFKQISNDITYSYFIWNDFYPSSQETSHYHYDLGRVAVKLGIEIGRNKK